jgi:long-chain acyl-CoA synthetase
MLAYLPLAYIFKIALKNFILFISKTLRYSNPRTLADSLVKNCANNMQEFRPTIIVRVS